MPVVIS